MTQLSDQYMLSVIASLYRRDTLFYKEPLYREPTCRLPESQSRIKKPVPFIWSQNQHRLFAMPCVQVFHVSLVFSYSHNLKAKFRTSMFTCTCTICIALNVE